MPIVSEDEIMKLENAFAKGFVIVDAERGAVDSFDAEQKDKGVDPSLFWNGGRTYRVFDNREYLAVPPGADPSSENPDFEALTFFYLKIRKGGELIARTYSKGSDDAPYTLDDMQKFIDNSIKDARSRTPSEPSQSPEGTNWNSAGFVGFFLDNEDWRLRERDFGDGKARSVSFNVQKAVAKRADNSSVFGDGETHQNWSFFRARNYTIEDGSGMQYLVVENHHNRTDEEMVRRSASDHPKTFDEYKFDLLFSAKLLIEEGATNTDKKELLIVVDPGGRNTGP
ncbi:MAG: hypothetical protein AAF687_04625 [Pseudomonadota bacterium]